MKEWAMFCEETEFLVPNLTAGAPTAGAFIYPRLDDGGALKVKPVNIVEELQAGNGLAMLGSRFSDATEAKGSIQLKLSRSQAKFLIGLALQNIDASRTLPFPTTDPSSVCPVGDLATFSIYHAVKAFDGSIRRRRYGGTRMNSLSISATSEKPRMLTVSIEIEAAKVFGNTDIVGAGGDPDPDTTEFPDPTFADLPNDIYLFSHMSLKVGSGLVVRPQCYSHEVKFSNKNDPQRYGSRWIQTAQFQGRDSQITSKLIYKTNPGDRGFSRASQSRRFNS